ncbi:Protein RRP5 [Clonorchis sinensis]|uniref:Protein RRP5 n=1 Tax=Clonorchis sinensis TaxID=79923 RepID=A0A8T1MBE9_CLOSI|nr:Protein RRP5 [Clonorchis sinensis]
MVTMQTEDLVLGRIKTVAKFYLDVCLPHGEIGRVNIYDISSSYSALVKEMVDSGEIDDSVAGLEDLFHTGQLVRCYVKKAIPSVQSPRASDRSKHLSELSLFPELVNKGITRKHIRARTHISGSVDTEEDHGYTIGTGIQGLNCFLPKSFIIEKVHLGSVMTFYPVVSDNITFLTSDTMRVLKVTTRLDNPSDLVLDPAAPVHFGCLTPGTWLRATLHKKVGSTLVAKFADYLISINRAHYRGSEDEYRIGMEVLVCLILVDPGTKQLTGSLLPHLLPSSFLHTSSCTTICKQLPIGMRLDNAVIERVDKRTIHLSVPGSETLQAVVRRAQLPTKLAVENLKSKFAPGQKVTCRVIDHDLLEDVAIATMKKKLLQLPFLSIEELFPGDLISAVVNRFTKTGVVVRAEDRLSGLIPYLHLADIPLKRPAEKFQRGQKIDCRVLTLDKGTNKLILTAKRGLVDASCSLFGSKEMFDWVQRGVKDQTLFAAFVVKISERGLLLSGLGELRAWLPRRETGLAPDDVLEATYFRGQVLRVRIVHALNDSSQDGGKETSEPNRSRSKFLVSLKLKGKNEPSAKQRKTQLSSVYVGQVFNAKVRKVQNTGLHVDLFPTDNASKDPSMWSGSMGSGFLAFDHLSDFESNCALFAQFMTRLKPGAVLDLDRSGPRSVVVINKASSTVIVSARPSLLRAASNHQLAESDTENKNVIDIHTGFVSEFNDLRVGTQWFAWVVNHVDYGIFVQFPSGIRGLAPVRLLTDTRIPKHVALTSLFPTGATVIAKVVELASSEKRRCLVTLRMLDTYFVEEHYVDIAIRSLENCITELEWLSRRQHLLSGFRIGDLIEFQAETLDTIMVSGQVSRLKAEKAGKHPVPAIAYLANTDGIECVPGKAYAGVVSFIDLNAERLEVALSAWLVNSVRNRKNNAASTPRLGQKVSSITIAFRSRTIAVVALRGHASGCFGILPARRTFNDVLGGNAWAVGQRNDVTLRQLFSDEGTTPSVHLCTLAIYDPVTNLPVRRSTSLKSKNAVPSQEDYSSTELLANLVEGQQLSGLRFDRLVGNIAFFQLSDSKHQVVFCHLVNIAQTAKAVRSFQLHPPPVGTVMTQTATVLHTSAQDQRHSSNRRGPLSARLPEISFLEKPQVSVGDLVCAQLIQVHQDYWAVHLPGGARGRLHVTAMLHSKTPKPLELAAKTNTGNQVRQLNPSLATRKDLGTGLKKDRLITCRIIDKLEKPSKDADSAVRTPLYYVSTKPDVVRGGVECWSKRTPTFNSATEAFIKIRSPNGLLVALTHRDDMLIPFSPELQERLHAAEVRFRVGDHLCVRPLRMIENQLVGELVLSELSEEATTSDDHSDLLASATQELLRIVNEKRKKLQKHTTAFKESLKPVELTIYDNSKSPEPTYSSQLEKPGSKRHLPAQSLMIGSSKRARSSKRSVSESDSPGMKRPCAEYDDKQTQPAKKPKEAEDLRTEAVVNIWDIGDPTVVQKYADFILPVDFGSSEKVADSTKPVSSEDQKPKSKDNAVKENSVAAEWRLREKESRKAMLAALTAEEQCLPKGSLRPTTTEEYELTVRNAPSNATCWTAYMKHVLSGSELHSLTDARAIAERGLRAIASSAGLEPGEQDTQQARLLSFYLVMEAKELERCIQQQEQMTSLTGSDPVLETSEQANRLSQVLSRLVNLDQSSFTRRAIDILADIGQFERAEDLARRLIKSSPGEVDRWLSLLKVRFRAGRVAAAREAQRNAVNILRSIHLPRFLTSSARLEFEFGDADRAIGLFREQLVAHPKQKIIYEEFIKLLLLAGKSKEARSIRMKATEYLKPHECESLDELFNREPEKQADLP